MHNQADCRNIIPSIAHREGTCSADKHELPYQIPRNTVSLNCSPMTTLQ
uniref:Uncharacterized protein n=1 Tax=Arundo donax TaxID=35708 RepID=A0A0A9HG06_ARUDO